MPVRPFLLHRMALVSFRLFCKNLGNLQDFAGQMVPSPPVPPSWQKIARMPMYSNYTNYTNYSNYTNYTNYTSNTLTTPTKPTKLCHTTLNTSTHTGVRAIFCRGGGGKPFAQKTLASCPNFYKTVEQKRGPYRMQQHRPY